jgi:hypothetical protein
MLILSKFQKELLGYHITIWPPVSFVIPPNTHHMMPVILASHIHKHSSHPHVFQKRKKSQQKE